MITFWWHNYFCCGNYIHRALGTCYLCLLLTELYHQYSNLRTTSSLYKRHYVEPVDFLFHNDLDHDIVEGKYVCVLSSLDKNGPTEIESMSDDGNSVV